MAHLQVTQKRYSPMPSPGAPEYSAYGPGEGGTGGHSGPPSVVSAYSRGVGDGSSEASEPRRHFRSSTKAQALIQEIDELESRATFLENRNKWLTEKLINLQKSVVGKSIGTSGKRSVQKTFHAWREAMHEMRLEHHLEQQTKSLEECKEVAVELGRELRNEQERSAQAEARRRAAQEQLSGVSASVHDLKRKLHDQDQRAMLMQQKLRTVEDYVQRKRNHAGLCVEEGSKYDRRKREIEMNFREETDNISAAAKYHDPRQTRQEAQEVMSKVQHLIPARTGSPDPPTVPHSRSATKSVEGPSHRSPVLSRDMRMTRHQDDELLKSTDMIGRDGFGTLDRASNELFDQIDRDGDGFITRHEFELAKQRGMLSRERIISEVAKESVPAPPTLTPQPIASRLAWQIGEAPKSPQLPVQHLPVAPGTTLPPAHFVDGGVMPSHQVVSAIPQAPTPAMVQRPVPAAYPSGGSVSPAHPPYHVQMHTPAAPPMLDGSMQAEAPEAWWRQQRPGARGPALSTI